MISGWWWCTLGKPGGAQGRGAVNGCASQDHRDEEREQANRHAAGEEEGTARKRNVLLVLCLSPLPHPPPADLLPPFAPFWTPVPGKSAISPDHSPSPLVGDVTGFFFFFLYPWQPGSCYKSMKVRLGERSAGAAGSCQCSRCHQPRGVCARLCLRSSFRR